MRGFLCNRLLRRPTELENTSTTTHLFFKSSHISNSPESTCAGYRGRHIISANCNLRRTDPIRHSIQFSAGLDQDRRSRIRQPANAWIEKDERQMGWSDIFFMDLGSNSCPVDHCGQISKLLPKLLANSQVVIPTENNVPFKAKTSFSPYLILLKSRLTETDMGTLKH